MRFASLLALPRSLRRLSGFALLLLLGSTAPAAAATIYVDDWDDDQTGAGTSTNPYRKLQVAIDRAQSGDTIYIRAGHHVAEPVEIIDPICGNCPVDEIYRDIYVITGFHIANKSLILQGESRNNTFLETHAGYGIYFENAGSSRLENVTVTEGVRDYDKDATSAAVVVRWTSLVIRNANIRDNTHRVLGEGEVVAGIAGIVGREGAAITADNLWIFNNGWDGIALYRGDPEIVNSGPRATITNVDIDLGRGDGIGATWDSRADIKNVRISRYWKGVGSFGNAQVALRNSIVRDQAAWGVMAYGAAHMTAVNNVIAFQGRFGLGQWTPDATVVFKNNIVYQNGRNPYDDVGPRAGIWLTNTARATVQSNDTYGNAFFNVCVAGGPGTDPYGCNREHALLNNLSVYPSFVDVLGNNFALRCGSPLINAGDPLLFDPDGTRSDIGAYGGPGSIIATSCFLPDLFPTKITGIPKDVKTGDVIYFDSAVRNESVSSSGYFNVKWFIDGNQTHYAPHAGLPANTTVPDGASSFYWTATPGHHTVTFSLDVDNHLLEGNEANNSVIATFYVRPDK